MQTKELFSLVMFANCPEAMVFVLLIIPNKNNLSLGCIMFINLFGKSYPLKKKSITVCKPKKEDYSKVMTTESVCNLLYNICESICDCGAVWQLGLGTWYQCGVSTKSDIAAWGWVTLVA